MTKLSVITILHHPAEWVEFVIGHYTEESGSDVLKGDIRFRPAHRVRLVRRICYRLDHDGLQRSNPRQGPFITFVAASCQLASLRDSCPASWQVAATGSLARRCPCRSVAGRDGQAESPRNGGAGADRRLRLAAPT